MPGNVGQLADGLECGEKTTGQNNLSFVVIWIIGCRFPILPALWLFCLLLVALSSKLIYQGSIKWLNINYVVVLIQQWVCIALALGRHEV